MCPTPDLFTKGFKMNINVPKDVRRTFSLMKYRCNTKTSPDYPRWGGRGIKVKYKDYYEFYADVGDKPSSKHSIDRIDPAGHYEVGNCRWATSKEQSNNLTTNHCLTYNGKTQTIKQWSEETGISYSTIRMRIVSGKSVEEALTAKVDSKKSMAGKIGNKVRYGRD